MVSHIEVFLPNKPPTPNHIGEGLKGPQRKFWKEALSVKYEKNKNVSLLSATILINSIPEGKKYPINSLILVSRKVNVLMHGNLLHATVKMGVLILRVFILINPTVQWHMLTHSESTMILRLCIYSLTGF